MPGTADRDPPGRVRTGKSGTCLPSAQAGKCAVLAREVTTWDLHRRLRVLPLSGKRVIGAIASLQVAAPQARPRVTLCRDTAHLPETRLTLRDDRPDVLGPSQNSRVRVS